MPGFVYIIEDNEGLFYIGSTDNLKRRLIQHDKRYTHTIKRMKEPKLAFSQMYESLEEARKIERKLKKLKRKDYLIKIISDGYIKTK